LAVPALTPEQRSLRARIAAHAMHARNDSRQTSDAGRKAFLVGFERQVDPEGVLPIAERQRRAEHARKAYFTRLALKSSRARRKDAA
jgi:hypothetical protein